MMVGYTNYKTTLFNNQDNGMNLDLYCSFLPRSSPLDGPLNWYKKLAMGIKITEP